MPTGVAALAGGIAGGAAGALVGGAFVRLPRAGFAAATWIVSWLVALAVLSVTWLLGGAQGTVVSGGPTTAGHYELALGLTALAVLGFAALARSPFGLGLAAAREREPAAAALGVPFRRWRDDRRDGLGRRRRCSPAHSRYSSRASPTRRATGHTSRSSSS